jgi:hypothetical protein
MSGYSTTGRQEAREIADEITGHLYVIACGTGIALDFAYAPLDARRRAGGDATVEPVTTYGVAVAYFLTTGRILGNASGAPILARSYPGAGEL